MLTVRKVVLVALAASLLAVVPFSPVRAAAPAYFIVQFWTPTVDLGRAGVWCHEVVRGRLSSLECAPRYAISPCPIRIPGTAKWMTITSSPDNMNINGSSGERSPHVTRKRRVVGDAAVGRSRFHPANSSRKTVDETEK